MMIWYSLANVKLTGIMQTSSEIAHSLSELMKYEQFQSISEEFSKELIKVYEFVILHCGR